MRIRSITVTYGRDIPIPRAGTARLEVSLAAEADAGDDICSTEELCGVLDTLWQSARNSVREQGLALIAQRGA